MKSSKDTVLTGLLTRTTGILKTHHEAMRKEGYMFNLYAIAKIERKEVNTHSAMITELLNPSGRHGQGDIFLKAFLKVIQEQLVNHACPPTSISWDALDCDHVEVKKEVSFNKGSERIDISVDFDDLLLIIENKVYAEDGDRQLKRYDEVGKKCGKGYCLLYLTRFGDEAKYSSSKGVVYSKISYQEHIISWLEQCIKEVALIPMVREGIVQYLNLVKKITGMGLSGMKNKDIIRLLVKDENIESVETLARQLNSAKGSLLYDFFKNIAEEMKKEGFKEFSGFEKSKGLDRVYNEKKCTQWFLRGKKKVHCIGIFLDIGIEGYLFHIQAATERLHYGLVKIHKGLKPIEIIGFEEEASEKIAFILTSGALQKRTWKHISMVWYSSDFGDVTLSLLRDPKIFIAKIKRFITDVTQSG